MAEIQTDFLYEVNADLDKPIGLRVTPHGN